MKNSFIIYHSYMEIFEDLTDEQLGKLFRAFFNYEINRIEPNFTGEMKIAFKVIKKDLDINLEKYENICERNRLNGLKGGRPRNPSGFNNNPNNPSGFLENPKKPKKAEEEEDEDKEEEYERDNDDFATSLSQRFPNIRQDVWLSAYVGDKDKLFQEIEKSEFLKTATLSFIIENQDKVLSGKYATFKPQKTKEVNFEQRRYSKEELSDVFDNLDEFELS